MKEVAAARAPDRDEFPSAWNQLALLLRQTGRHAEIVGLAEELERRLRENAAAPRDWLLGVWNAASEAHLRLGHPEEAHRLLARAIDEGERLLSPHSHTLAPLFSNLAVVMEALGRPEEALRARQRHAALCLPEN